MKRLMLFIILLGIFSVKFLVPIEIVYVDSWNLKMNENNILAGMGRASVDKDEYYYVPDVKMSNIKIFSNSGNLLSVFGVKGLGPDEFVRPTFSYIFKNEIIITDLGRRKYFLYKIDQKKKMHNLLEGNIDTAYDVCMDEQNIYISGYIVYKGNEYEIYLINKKNKNVEVYLPTKNKYTSIENISYSRKTIPEFAAIGIMGYLCIYKDDIYYVWEGDLKIYKINTRDLSISDFGEKTNNYVRPFISSTMKKGIFERNWKIKMAERKKMSHVDSIMVNSKYVILSYLSPNKNYNRRIRYFQFYDHTGNFKKEIKAPKRIGFSDDENGVTFYVKNNFIYSLHRYTNEDEKEIYEAVKYEIN